MQSNPVVNFRSKFVEAFGLKQNVTLCDFWTNICINFRKISASDASKKLFNLLYEDKEEVREETLNEIGLTVDSSKEQYVNIMAEQIPLLANELRYQYTEVHPFFLKVEDNPSCQKELNELKRVLTNHPLLLFKAVEMCKYSFESADIVSSCLNQLLSDNQNEQMNGLKALGLSYQYRVLLVPYANKIGQLLNSMHNAYLEQQRRQRIAAAQEELNKVSSPFVPQGDMLKQKRQKVETPSAAMPDVENTKKENVSELDKVIAHKSEIVLNLPSSDTHWNCLKKLRSIGIDLNMLVDNEAYIWPILSAHDTLENAVATLNEAEQAYKVAQSKFTMENYQSLINMFNAGKAFEDAKKAHKAAFDNFMQCCETYKKAVSVGK